MAAKAKQEQIEVPDINLKGMRITLEGVAPLVVHAWSDKAKKEMLDKQTGAAKQGKQPKVPANDFMQALYPMPGSEPVLHDEDPANIWADGRFGFPAIGFKAAAVRAATDADMKMTDIRRAFHINAELVEILGDRPKMREDMVRVGMGTADIRFRPEFTNWSAIVEIEFNAGVINPAKIVNLFRTAGFGVGIGEWRPEKNGRWGRFRVAGEIDVFDVG